MLRYAVIYGNLIPFFKSPCCHSGQLLTAWRVNQKILYFSDLKINTNRKHTVFCLYLSLKISKNGKLGALVKSIDCALWPSHTGYILFYPVHMHQQRKFFVLFCRIGY